jgi:integrase
MYEKDNRFYADWRTKKGVRRRKAFTSADAAQLYEEAQKNAARPKQKGAGHPSPQSCAPLSQRGTQRIRTPTPGTLRPISKKSAAAKSRRDATDVMLAAANSHHLAKTTRYVRMSALRHVLLYLHEEHGAPKLMKYVPKVRKSAPRNVTATAKEKSALLRAANPAMKCFILLCSDLAIRSGAAVKIAPPNYNMERMEISFRTKFDGAQVLPVTTELAALFARCDGDPSIPFVSQLSVCGHAKQTTMINYFARLRRKVGITRKLTPHDFRRTTAVAAYQITKDLRIVQVLLGHEELATTMHYLDLRNTSVNQSLLEAAKLNPTTETIQ